MWHSLREAASATNDEKARLRQTKPPNALPAAWRYPGQHKDVVGSFSLCTSSSPSVMAATIPAMWPAEFQQSLWRARTILVACANEATQLRAVDNKLGNDHLMKINQLAIWALAVFLLSFVPNLAQAFYNPQTGHWLSRDPIEEKGGFNVYEFTKNNPILLFDRNGLDVNSPPITAQPPIIPPPSTAGPDITDALEATLAQVNLNWKNNPTKHCAACKNLNAFPFNAASSSWDIKALQNLGKDGTPLSVSKPGTGEWARTVQFRYGAGTSKVYWASSINYVLWGKMHALCNAEFPSAGYDLYHARLLVHLRKDFPRPIGFGGDQSADADAFTQYGYNGVSPESVALPAGNRLGYNGQTLIYTADTKNIYPSKDSFAYHWEGLINGN